MFLADQLFGDSQTPLEKRQCPFVVPHFSIFPCEIVQYIRDLHVLPAKQFFSNRQTAFAKRSGLGVITHVIVKASQIANQIGNICIAAA